MRALEQFLINFKGSIIKEGETVKYPHLIRISKSLASDSELSRILDIQSDRGEFLGVPINVVPDFESFATYEEAFPDGSKS